jgi:outer membrane protein
MNIAVIAGVLMVFAVLGTGASAAEKSGKDASVVGFIDVEKVVKTHPALVKWNKDLEAVKAAREKDLEKQIKEKFGVTTESQLSDKQRAQVQKFILEENDKFTSEMAPKQTEKLKGAEKDIKTAAAAVAKEKGLTLIVDKMAVIYGGEDVTADVIKKLKDKK